MRTVPRHGALKMASLILFKQLLKRGAPQLGLGNLFSAGAMPCTAQLAFLAEWGSYLSNRPAKRSHTVRWQKDATHMLHGLCYSLGD